MASYPAIVVGNVDPVNGGRVKVRLPQVLVAGESGNEVWARMATLMAGANRGTWFIPDVDDEVLIAFEQSDLNRPYVLGGLWNSANPPPETMDVSNNKKLVRSRNGVQITLDDQGGRESIIMETPDGQKDALEDGPGAVVVTDSNGNSVELRTNGITCERRLESHPQRERGRGQCRRGERQRGHFKVQRGSAMRHADQQQRRQPKLRPGCGKYLVMNESLEENEAVICRAPTSLRCVFAPRPQREPIPRHCHYHAERCDPRPAIAFK